MSDPRNSSITTLSEIHKRLRVACEAFAKIPASANSDSWISVCGVQVRVGDLQVATAGYEMLGRELKRRRVATTPVYVQQRHVCWRLTLSDWIELCESGAKGKNSHPASYKGFELMALPLAVEEYTKSARRNGAIPRYTHRKEFFYAETLDWTPADFQGWLDEWRKEY
jgi:hypothetical protein